MSEPFVLLPPSVEAGLCRPWHRLRLPADLEALYRAEHAAPAGIYLQSWLLVFIVFNLLSLKIDLDLFGADAIAIPAGLTLGVFVPLALLSILLLRGHPTARR